jgi:hypothetical protein
MKLFKCQHCGQIIYFENQKCEKCGHRLGYMPDDSLLSALEPQDNAWRALAVDGHLYRFCANRILPRRGERTPDGLLFRNDAAKAQANKTPEEWRRYEFGLAVVESKRWRRPLDRRASISAPSSSSPLMRARRGAHR